MLRLVRIFCAAGFLLALPVAVHAQFRGHGGPVRALAISPEPNEIVSGSFDQSAIRWSLRIGTAEQILRFHEGAINAIASISRDIIATASEDGRIALWRRGETAPYRVLTGHEAPIAALAVSPDGKQIASAAWDRTVRVWSLSDGQSRTLEGHTQNVNGVAFLPDGAVVSVSHDATIRIWPADDSVADVTQLDTPLNAVVASPDGEIIAASASGKIYFVGRDRKLRRDIDVAGAPLVSLSLSPDGKTIAASGVRGAVTLIDGTTTQTMRTLVGPGLPVWSSAFSADGAVLYTGGADGLVRRWNVATGEPLGDAVMARDADPLASHAGDRGAEVYRACVACHTLKGDEGNRAGPSLHGIFGRRIATLPGYDYSVPLRQMDIVWTKETVAKLFEIGPSIYTPGTKMPEQRITSADDRAALVDFLERATR